MQMFDLKGKVALVTGGGTGIGLGIAEGLAAAGAKVVLSGRRREVLDDAADKITASGGHAAGICADVKDPDACSALVEQTCDRFGRVDILINNAGINHRHLPQDYALADWTEVMDVNLRSAFLLCQQVYPHFKRQGGGKIVMIASLASLCSNPSGVAYAPSKGGMVQLARTLAVAWAQENIQVNSILPGWIDTPLSRGARATFPDLEESVIQRTPAGRWGVPPDFAGPAVFLASSASDFVNGASLLVDGGYSAVI